jgi:hypothetical protein
MPTFSELLNDIRSTTEVSSSDFDTQLPRIVNRAENRLIKELDDFGLNTLTSITVSINNPVVSLPSGTRIVRNLNVLVSASVSAPAGTADTKVNLLPRTQEFIFDFWPYVSASVGEPKYYAMQTNTNIYIAPTPEQTYDAELTFVQRPVTLSDSNPTNYFSDFCYDALFYACMIESSFYLKSFDTVQLWQAEYKNAIDGLRNQARRTRQDDMAQAASPAGSADTVIMGSS